MDRTAAPGSRQEVDGIGLHFSDQAQKSEELISEMYAVSFAHSRASEGKHAVHVPPAPGMARAADPDGPIDSEIDDGRNIAVPAVVIFRQIIPNYC